MKRRKILALSAALAAIAVAAGFAVRSHRRAAQYELLLQNSRTHACYELTAAVSELDAALQKARYAATPSMLQILCTDIYGKAVAAQMALGELPDSAALLEQTCAFLARTGDYACAAVKSAAASGQFPEETRAALGELAGTSASLATSLLDIQSVLMDGSLSVDELLRLEQAVEGQTGGAAAGGSAFQAMEADFPETPTLIYDGPFSEHLSRRTPLALEALAQVSQTEAHAAAARLLGVPQEQLTPCGQGDGAVPTWCFSADGGQTYLELTRQGGRLLALVGCPAAGPAVLTPEEAARTAQRFLAACGFDRMEESYHIRQGSTLTLHFAPAQEGVFCYPDLVKVSVALDTGEVTGLDSHGWIMNHTARSFPAPAVSEEAARAAVSDELDVLAHQLALIPTGGQYEVLCHEFKCRTPENTHVIVYVNAATGNEEKLLLLLEDENGTLVW